MWYFRFLNLFQSNTQRINIKIFLDQVHKVQKSSFSVQNHCYIDRNHKWLVIPPVYSNLFYFKYGYFLHIHGIKTWNESFNALYERLLLTQNEDPAKRHGTLALVAKILLGTFRQLSSLNSNILKNQRYSVKCISEILFLKSNFDISNRSLTVWVLQFQMPK